MAKNKIKPCPFCGGVGEVRAVIRHPDLQRNWVQCRVCRSMGPSGTKVNDQSVEEVENMVINYWNGRAM